MLGKIEGRRRRRQQGISDSMDMSLSNSRIGLIIFIKELLLSKW